MVLMVLVVVGQTNLFLYEGHALSGARDGESAVVLGLHQAGMGLHVPVRTPAGQTNRQPSAAPRQ